MGRSGGWAEEQSERALVPSPGRPGVNQLEAKQAFRRRMQSEAAASACGVSQPLGPRWFREAGGIPPINLVPHSGRYLSFAEREEIALLKAQRCGVREIARQLGRSPSTISRQLRRNAATRSGSLQYRAAVAQWKVERVTKRSKLAKPAENERLPVYVQDRLAGVAMDAEGRPIQRSDVPWKGRRHGLRADWRWGTAGARCRLAADWESTSRMMHPCVSPTKPSTKRSIVQGSGALRRELSGCLRTGRALRVPRARTRQRASSSLPPR
ncbi:helix-turn-helix domain-containing protein [Rhodanobacter glycinis]|nr:helix-turn-helix domain-containing protein [Rhodanobacter glycinis]